MEDEERKETEKEEQTTHDVIPENIENGIYQSSPRGSLPKKGFLEFLAKKADEIKHQSIELGKIAAKEAEELGDKIDDAVDEGWDAAKKFKPKPSESKNEIIDLIERLAKLKDDGIITEKEFNAKKKDLLGKI